MRILAYADVQATEGHERLFSDPTVPLQRWRVQRFYTRIAEICDEMGCQAVWDLGDTTDDRAAIPVHTLNTIAEGIARLPSSPWNLKLIGNHEQTVKSTEINTGVLYSPKFKVITGREKIQLRRGVTVVAVSFPENDRELAVWLNEILAHRQASEKFVLIGHFQVSGAAMNSGVSLDGVPLSILKPFGVGMLGHVHKGQALIADIHYVGSPFQQNFGESADTKRVAIFDTDTLKIEWVSMDACFPEYRTVTVDEFASQDAQGEDRLAVVLRNPKEAEHFYSHPLSPRAASLACQYDLTPSPQSASPDQLVTPQAILKRFVQLNPPANGDIVISDDDMVDFGLQIAGVTE